VAPAIPDAAEPVATCPAPAADEPASADGIPAAEAAPPAPSPEDAGADLVAARGGLFSLEPEKLAMVRDFVHSGLVPYACRLRVSKDAAALCARNFIISAGWPSGHGPRLEPDPRGSARGSAAS
jgi:hypothetical protein